MQQLIVESRIRATSPSTKQHNCDYKAVMDTEGEVITTTQIFENNVEEELSVVQGDSGMKAIIIINKSPVSCKIKVSTNAPSSTEIILPPGFPYFYYGLDLTVNGSTNGISTLKVLFENLPAIDSGSGSASGSSSSGSGSSSSGSASSSSGSASTEYEKGIIETIAVY